MWVKFATIEEFNTWHEQIKLELGLPLSDKITTDYTQAIQVEDGSYSAWVEELYAKELPEGTPAVVKKWNF